MNRTGMELNGMELDGIELNGFAQGFALKGILLNPLVSYGIEWNSMELIWMELS